MRSVWFLNRPIILVLGAALLCAPLIQTRVGSQSLSNNDRDRPRVALGRSFQARATASDRGVLIEWRTGFDPDNLGFNVYRVSGGQRTQVNPDLIAGSALIARQQNPPGSYAWFDAGGNLSSEYSVESIDVRGESAAHDTIKPEWSAALPNRPTSELLVNLGATARAASKQDEFPDLPLTKLQESSAEGIGGASLNDQWNLLANQPALKIGVQTDGWYRITQAQMAAAGFVTSADARNLRLFVGGNEIAMRTSRDSGALTAADYVEFWGQGLDLATTDTQMYWLVNGAQAGKRIAIAGEVSTNALPVPPVKLPPAPIAPQDTPVFWFGGVRSGLSVPSALAGALDTQVGSRQLSEPPAVAGGPDTQVSSRQLSVPPASAGGSDTQPGSRPLPVPPASGGGSDTQVGSKQRAVSTNSKFQIQKSKLRRHRRRSRRPRRNHPTMTLAAAPNFISTVQRKDRTLNFARALNGDQENFYGQVINASSAPLPLTLRNVETTSAATAQIQVALQGVSLLPHQINVLVNNNLAGTISYLYQDAAVQTFSIPVSWLLEGANTVTILAPGNDVSLLDYVRLSYPHSFIPDNDSLQFSVKSTLAARIDGFTSANIRVLDISDPANVQAVHPIIETSGAGFALTIQPVGRTKGRRLVALPNSQLSNPASLALNAASTLNANTNAADLLVISYKDFIPSLTTVQPPSSLSFVTLRQTQAAPNYATMVVDVEDIFDEFSYGVHTPQAIRDFLSLANATWATKPRYVLLVGDASLDPRNYQGSGKFDFVPTKLVDTGFRGQDTALETASDDWLTDFDGDGIADISIGRLPVRTLAEANTVVGKVVNYSPSTPPQSALLVADAQGSYYFDFEASDNQIAALLPASLTKQKVYRSQQPSDAQTHAEIVNGFNSGQVLVVYSGHGNVDIWGGSIFSATDAMALTNGNKLPFVVVMDCLNGYFADPYLQSLAEALVKAPNGGAVASFASSGLTIPDGQHAMGQVMFDLLYGHPTTIPIGDASRQSKASTTDMDVRRTWILFGDPTMKIR